MQIKQLLPNDTVSMQSTKEALDAKVTEITKKIRNIQ